MMTERAGKQPIGLGPIFLGGLLGGLLVLGVGGRLAMRALAFITPEDPRFTLAGTLQILALGTAWGGLTSPLWFVCRTGRSRLVRALSFGTMTFGLATVGFALLDTFAGDLVAPVAFLVLGAIVFPLLFFVHAWLVELMASRWRHGPRNSAGGAAV